MTERRRYGKLTFSQESALVKYVSGREVHDLGCGTNTPMVQTLLDCGAATVIAVDKEPSSMSLPKRVTYVQSTLRDYNPASIDVALLSWPLNNEIDGLFGLVSKARVLIYLGKNTDGTACGTRILFEHMVRRRLLVHKPHPKNTLIVVGDPLGHPRKPTDEEWAGIDQSEIYAYGIPKKESADGP